MEIKRYLLSDGQATTKMEEYIIDLFRIYLTVYPKDIPHYSKLGFDFLLTNVTKDGLKEGVTNKVNSLIDLIQESVGESYKITIAELDLIDEETVRLVIDVDGVESEEIYINLYQEE